MNKTPEQLQRLREFAQQMDWEGGALELYNHGYDPDIGDAKLEDALERLGAASEAFGAVWENLIDAHPEILDFDEEV